MRVLYGIIVFFALFLLACSDAEREEKRLEGNLLMKGDSGVCYDGIGPYRVLFGVVGSWV